MIKSKRKNASKEPARKPVASSAEPSSDSDDSELVLYFVPSLVATLLNRERTAGRPLTEAEVLAIRDDCPVVALREETARLAAKERGYPDIDADRCWEVWQEVREELHKHDPPPSGKR